MQTHTDTEVNNVVKVQVDEYYSDTGRAFYVTKDDVPVSFEYLSAAELKQHIGQHMVRNILRKEPREWVFYQAQPEGETIN